MAYMAVGSRQILFSDQAAPAQTGTSQREVANLSDNAGVPATTAGSAPVEAAPAQPVSGDAGTQVDVRA